MHKHNPKDFPGDGFALSPCTLHLLCCLRWSLGEGDEHEREQSWPSPDFLPHQVRSWRVTLDRKLVFAREIFWMVSQIVGLRGSNHIHDDNSRRDTIRILEWRKGTLQLVWEQLRVVYTIFRYELVIEDCRGKERVLVGVSVVVVVLVNLFHSTKMAWKTLIPVHSSSVSSFIYSHRMEEDSFHLRNISFRPLVAF